MTRRLSPAQEEARAVALGAACEALVLRSLAGERPWWIRSVRRARRQEDRKGVDIVVHTIDCGRLFLQVKRSRRYLERWAQRWGSDPRPIAVVIARETDDPAEVRGRALGALILLRERRGAEEGRR